MKINVSGELVAIGIIKSIELQGFRLKTVERYRRFCI